MKKYIWDFFGRDAREIAAHKQVHLEEFAQNKNIPKWETGTFSDRENHCAVWISTDDKNGQDLIRTVLRPKRIDDN